MHLIPQSGAHLHILLNHFPSVGFVIALGFFITALVMRNELMQRSCLVVFIILGVLAIPTYLSGASAMWTLSGDPAIPQSLIDAHREMALFAFFGLGITGCVAWLILWRARHAGQTSKRSLLAVLALAVITLYLMAETGHLGGYINHPEVRPDTVASAAESSGLTVGIERRVSIEWTVPMQVMHYLGMSLIFGTVLILALRVLGLGKSLLSFAAVHRLLPLGLLGLLMNVVSGFVLFLFDSSGYVEMAGFPPKIALLVIGTVAILYFSLFQRIWHVKVGDDAPMVAQVVAVVTLLSWTGVIIFGRLLPYV